MSSKKPWKLLNFQNQCLIMSERIIWCLSHRLSCLVRCVMAAIHMWLGLKTLLLMDNSMFTHQLIYLGTIGINYSTYQYVFWSISLVGPAILMFDSLLSIHWCLQLYWYLKICDLSIFKKPTLFSNFLIVFFVVYIAFLVFFMNKKFFLCLRWILYFCGWLYFEW